MMRTVGDFNRPPPGGPGDVPPNAQPANIEAGAAIPNPNENFHVYILCKKLINPNPVKVIKNIIIFDSSVFTLDLIIALAYMLTRPIVPVASVIFQVILVALILTATLLNLRGLEDAVRMKRLNQRLCCYNIARVVYYILLTLEALSYFLGFLLPSQKPPVWIQVWAVILFLLCSVGFLLQPAIYTIIRNYTATAPRPNYFYHQPGGQLYQGQHYGQHQLPPGWQGDPQVYRAQQPVMMQEIDMRPQQPGASGRNVPPIAPVAPPGPKPFNVFAGQGTSIGGSTTPAQGGLNVSSK